MQYTQRTTKPGYDTDSSDLRGTSYELTYPPSSLGSGKSKSATTSKLSHSRLEEARVPDGLPHLTHVDSQSAGPSGPPIPTFSRRPTTTPVLLPEYRYCSKCQIVKPSRAHHCRACGTVGCFLSCPCVHRSDLVPSVS